MSVQARVNQLLGGNDTNPTVSPYLSGSNYQIDIPGIGSWINVTTTTSTTLGGTGTTNPVFTMPSWARGRMLWFYNSGSNDAIFKNNDGTTTPGYMDLGGSDITVGPTDVLCVYVRQDGSAIRVFNTNN